MQYTNRKGDQYFIFEGRTKTGKPKYFASRKETSDKGKRLDALPGNYEIAEHPRNATVSIRKTKPTRILDAELEFVRQSAVELSGYEEVKVDRQGDQLTIYTPDRNVGEIDSIFSSVFGGAGAGMADWAWQNMSYTAMLRLTLADEDNRIFESERYCFRGGIDDWIWLSHSGHLAELAQELFPHLSQESFYELM